MTDLRDSGLRYCTEHHGVIECDADRCDFVDRYAPDQKCLTCGGTGFVDDEASDVVGAVVGCTDCDGGGGTPCKPTPLFYERVAPKNAADFEQMYRAVSGRGAR